MPQLFFFWKQNKIQNSVLQITENIDVYPQRVVKIWSIYNLTPFMLQFDTPLQRLQWGPPKRTDFFYKSTKTKLFLIFAPTQEKLGNWMFFGINSNPEFFKIQFSTIKRCPLWRVRLYYIFIDQLLSASKLYTYYSIICNKKFQISSYGKDAVFQMARVASWCQEVV